MALGPYGETHQDLQRPGYDGYVTSFGYGIAIANPFWAWVAMVIDVTSLAP